MTFYHTNIAPLMYLDPFSLTPFAINPVKRGIATFSRCQTVREKQQPLFGKVPGKNS